MSDLRELFDVGLIEMAREDNPTAADCLVSFWFAALDSDPECSAIPTCPVVLGMYDKQLGLNPGTLRAGVAEFIDNGGGEIVTDREGYEAFVLTVHMMPSVVLH